MSDCNCNDFDMEFGTCIGFNAEFGVLAAIGVTVDDEVTETSSNPVASSGIYAFVIEHDNLIITQVDALENDVNTIKDELSSQDETIKDLSNRVSTNETSITNINTKLVSDEINISELQNNVSDINTSITNINTVLTTKADSSAIPTKTSQLNNDSDFTTNEIVLSGLNTKADKTVVNELAEFTSNLQSQVTTDISELVEMIDDEVQSRITAVDNLQEQINDKPSVSDLNKKMDYFKVIVDRGLVYKDTQVVPYNDLLTAYNDKTIYLYMVHNNLTLTPNLSGGKIKFSTIDNSIMYTMSVDSSGYATYSETPVGGGSGEVVDVYQNGVSVLDNDKIARVTTPTKTSELTNDSGFADTEYFDNKLTMEVGTEYEEYTFVETSDIATSNTLGIIKANHIYGITTDTTGNLLGVSNSKASYDASPDSLIISKGTLNNVLGNVIDELDTLTGSGVFE